MNFLTTSARSVATRASRRNFSKGWSGGGHSYLPPTYSRQRHSAGNNVGLYIVGGIGIAAGIGSAIVMSLCEDAETKEVTPTSPSFEPLRTKSFPIESHNHGKTRVRVMKVVKDDKDPSKHSIHEFNVTTNLHAEAEYEKCYTHGDNSNLVATDTQKNSVYLVAKRTKFNSPEGFGALLCHHLLKEYPMLDKVEATVDEVVWERAVVDGEPHAHSFLKSSPETYSAKVSWTRSDPGPKIVSSISKMTILKTTQSGFEGYLQDDYTLLPPTTERCMATELDASWTCEDGYYSMDYSAARKRIRELIQKGLFGPPKSGIYSPSLQASVYDAACLVLEDLPGVESITIHTPNVHYLPAKLLDRLGESFDDDVFIPTNEPSGIITCTVTREKSAEEEKKDEEYEVEQLSCPMED